MLKRMLDDLKCGLVWEIRGKFALKQTDMVLRLPQAYLSLLTGTPTWHDLYLYNVCARVGGKMIKFYLIITAKIVYITINICFFSIYLQ